MDWLALMAMVFHLVRAPDGAADTPRPRPSPTPHARQRRRPKPRPDPELSPQPTHSPTPTTVPEPWHSLAECESDLRWHYRGIHHGGLQFAPSTWAAFRRAGEPRYAWQADPMTQVAVARRVLEAQGWGAWPTCRHEIGR